MTEAEIAASFADLEIEDVREVIRYASGAMHDRELPPVAFGRASS